MTAAASRYTFRRDLPLEGGGGEVAERGVPAVRVVEALDVVEDGRLRLRAGPEDGPIEQFTFEGGEEALGDGIGLGFQLHLTASFHPKPYA